MFTQVVVGVDDDQGSRDAIKLAASLLAPDGQLTLAHICPEDPYAYPGEAAKSDHATAVVERARQETGVSARSEWRGSTSVGRGLHELCESLGADLLVVGSTRQGVLGRAVLGDDTLASLNAAPCAVAIAPRGFAHESVLMREIGVAYDGSPESEHALGLGRKLAAESGARLSAFQAVALPTSRFGPGPLPVSDTIERFVNDARDRIAALGGVEPHAAYGEPAEELAVYSASVDLLIVGSRGYGPLGRLIHGSTSRRLARGARCPLLVLTRAAQRTNNDESREGTAEVAATPRS